MDVVGASVEVVLDRAAGGAVGQQASVRRAVWGVGFGGPVLALRLVAGQQRIALQLRLDEGVELQVGELQQLDRLLQLGRDDQTLALAEF